MPPDQTSLTSTQTEGNRNEIVRGRSEERGLRSLHPFERAESRARRDETAVEIDATFIGKRGSSRSGTFFENPYDPKATLEDHILEPCPHIPNCGNVSEVLGSTTKSNAVIFTPIRRANTITSLSNLSLSSSPLSALSTSAALHNSRVDFKGSNLRTRCMSQASLSTIHPVNLFRSVTLSSETSSRCHTILNRTPPAPATSLAHQLPLEILQQVFLQLSPTDFNSARHSCRSWLIHSLSRSLLETFLRRMGFSDAIRTSSTLIRSQSQSPQLRESYEWLLSKRIARECALGPDWSDHGLQPNTASCSATKSAFIPASTIDFTNIADHYPEAEAVRTLFTVSSCGRFLMVANGCLVYIYELGISHRADPGMRVLPESANLRLVTTITFPKRILACSMDTSSNRYAIAILLDGRMGEVCDIPVLAANSPTAHAEKHSRNEDSPEPYPYDSSNRDTNDINFSAKLKMHVEPKVDNAVWDSTSASPSFANTSTPFPSVARSAWQDLFKDDNLDSSGSSYDPNTNCLPLFRVPESDGPQSFTLAVQKPLLVPVEHGLRSVYRNLCSEDDPPRSVAICPQRRCVAFGCSSGIELHWVDALTGQNLNRWFPLAAPSDYLFFVPPRKSVDSAKKLRLISSAAKPTERLTVGERKQGREGVRGNQYLGDLGQEFHGINSTEPFEDRRGALPRLAGEINRRYTPRRIEPSDHYRAIPLSDGHHILFTDPATGLLCLGSDAPVGGPTKLLRKILFQGPEGQGSPVAYAGGSDLTSGVRVVAAFGGNWQQSIWLFSVPSDIFASSQTELSSLVGSRNLPNVDKDTPNTSWMAWWPDDDLQKWLNSLQNPVPGVPPRSAWPVKIKGQCIGTCNDIADLTINSGPHMTIWAFGNDGVASSWQVDSRDGEPQRKYIVSRDGTVRTRNSVPFDSDLLSCSLSLGSFDGMATYPALETNHHQIHVRQHSRITPYQQCLHPQVDADGDIIMTDAQSTDNDVWMEGGSSEEPISDEVGRFVQKIAVVNEGLTRATCIRVEGLMDITRLNLEIYS
jgi:hypothetical protein